MSWSVLTSEENLTERVRLSWQRHQRQKEIRRLITLLNNPMTTTTMRIRAANELKRLEQ